MNRIVYLLIIALSLTGCTTSARYFSYTDQKHTPKTKDYFITVYYDSQRPPSNAPYYVVGKVEVSGHASDGVDPATLIEKAKNIARKKGADAIISAKIENISYGGVYVYPGHFGYHHYHPTEYLPYNDVLLTFRGELIVFNYEQQDK